MAGLIAKRRIRAAKGTLGGDGLASAGIALGCLWTLAAVVLVAVELSGAFDANNAGEYKGQQRQIAQVVDRVERAFDDDHGAQACTQLFTPAFARAIAKGGRTTCPRFVNDAVGNGDYQANIDVQSIDVAGDRATVEVKEGGDDEVWRMVRRDGRWLVSAIES